MMKWFSSDLILVLKFDLYISKWKNSVKLEFYYEASRKLNELGFKKDSIDQTWNV